MNHVKSFIFFFFINYQKTLVTLILPDTSQKMAHFYSLFILLLHVHHLNSLEDKFHSVTTYCLLVDVQRPHPGMDFFLPVLEVHKDTSHTSLLTTPGSLTDI